MINRVRVIERVKYSLRYKHRRGHRIHSPYVYSVVRELFIKNKLSTIDSHTEIAEILVANSVDYDYAYRIGQFLSFNKLTSYCVNPQRYNNEDIVIFTDMSRDYFEIIQSMEQTDRRCVALFLKIYQQRECRARWRALEGLKLDLYKLGVIVIDKTLNNEYYKLKIS